jgi:hypothetical protein
LKLKKSVLEKIKESIGVLARMSTLVDCSVVVVDHSLGRDFSVRGMLSMILSALLGWRRMVMFGPS